MTNDQLNTLTQRALEQLGSLLEAGHSHQLIAFLQAMGRFRRYSFQNLCLITSQRPTATHVAGFHAWRTLGRSVRKGEKGIVILAPIVVKRIADDDGAAARVAGFRAAYVFDIAQTDGQPLPQAAAASGDPGASLIRLRAAIQSRGIAIEEVAELSGAVGMSLGGRIQIVTGLSGAEAFVVLVHEFAHELLHRTGERPSRDTRELEAEAVAFVVGESIGLQVGDAARDYIHLYRGDRDALIASLERIRVASATILTDLDNDCQTTSSVEISCGAG